MLASARVYTEVSLSACAHVLSHACPPPLHTHAGACPTNMCALTITHSRHLQAYTPLDIIPTPCAASRHLRAQAPAHLLVQPLLNRYSWTNMHSWSQSQILYVGCKKLNNRMEPGHPDECAANQRLLHYFCGRSVLLNLVCELQSKEEEARSG